MTDTKLSRSGEISTEDSEMIEHFLVLMYDETCPHKAVDKCRKYLFTQMNRIMDNGLIVYWGFIEILLRTIFLMLISFIKYPLILKK